MDILTGSNQVINPEYVAPLESKESPLSLLAKTCSNIGVDQPSRPTATVKPSKEGSKSPPASSSSSSPAPSSRQSSRRSPQSSHRPSSNASSQISPRTKEEGKTPAARSAVSFKPYESAVSERSKSRSPAKTTSPRPAAAAVTSPAAAVTSPAAASPSAKESPKPATSLLAPYGLGSPLDALYLRSGLPPAACRDPLCKGCLPGMCPTGCLQCKTLSPLGSAAPLSLGLYPPPGLVGGLQPYCCNWSEAGAYCGKRFNTSDELMQHLRGHTSADAPVLPSLSPLLLPRAPYTAALPALAPARYHPYAKPGLAPPLAPSLAPSSLALYPYLANPYLYAGLRR